jgi:pimeloyl-ACP methyl ester carboxylesterase
MMRVVRFGIFLLPLVQLMLCNGAFAETTVVTGVVGPGASYACFVPDNWNGSVIYYAHGYRTPNFAVEAQWLGFQNHLEFEMSETAFFREPLLEMGFAFALSTYSSNGFAVKEGVQTTHQLRGLFSSQFGKPRRSYLMGQSLGGLITIQLAEKYPKQYDGALPFCGVVGGLSKAHSEKLHLAAILDYYYPGLLPGDAADPPEGIGLFDYYLGVGPFVVGEIATAPLSAIEIAGIEQLDICAADFGELLDTYFSRLFIYYVGAAEAIDRTQGHPFFDNMDTDYQGSGDDAALNAAIGRFEAHPDALNYLEHHYEPTGRLRIPVLTLHNLCDPQVPISHEEKYEKTVEATESDDWLVRRHVDRFGHCGFTKDEIVACFLDLVDWVENRLVPEGGELILAP